MFEGRIDLPAEGEIRRSTYDTWLSRQTAGQVGKVAHAQAHRDLSQTLAAGREEATQKSNLSELLQCAHQLSALLPIRSKNPRELARNRCLPLAEQPAGVVDQKEIASQRKSFCAFTACCLLSQ